jgi:ABC-type multidrug transport system permease subunit
MREYEMAASAKMIALGIGVVLDIFILIVFAYVGDKVFNPLEHWLYSFTYTSAPLLDPGLISWVPSMFFGVLIGCFFALFFVMYLVAVSEQTNQYGPGGF